MVKPQIPSSGCSRASVYPEISGHCAEERAGPEVSFVNGEEALEETAILDLD